MMNASAHPLSAVIAAAGQSRRMGGGEKVLMDLGGRTVLEHSLERIATLPGLVEVVLVVSKGAKPKYEGALRERLEALKVAKIVAGGAHRFDSVCSGVEACGADSELVLIHDGARPFPPMGAVRGALDKAASMGAAILAVPLNDTLKRAGDDWIIQETLPRRSFFRAQTPQVFNLTLLRACMVKARSEGLSPTDEACVLEAAGKSVALVQGSESNIKITTPEDLALARALLAAMEEDKK